MYKMMPLVIAKHRAFSKYEMIQLTGLQKNKGQFMTVELVNLVFFNHF